ncbi:hypothetical protein RCH16_003220 [Cryobacterium sp. MP_M5]|nr:hypothetical protein [Cryobacterium sp. MP_M5]
MELFVLVALSLPVIIGVAIWGTWGIRVAGRSAGTAVPRRRASDAVPALTPPSAASAPAVSSTARPGVALSRYLPPQDWARLLVADAGGLPTLYLQPHGGELWLTEPTTGLLVSISNVHLRGLGIWTIWLRNVDSRTIVAREGLIQPGAMVSLVREPGHPAAGGAVSVHSSSGRRVGQVSPPDRGGAGRTDRHRHRAPRCGDRLRPEAGCGAAGPDQGPGGAAGNHRAPVPAASARRHDRATRPGRRPGRIAGTKASRAPLKLEGFAHN